MKRNLLKVVAFIVCLMTVFSTIGCATPITGEGDDASKADVFFYYYDGDGKKDWIKDAAKEFNATLEDYEIRPVGTLNEDYEKTIKDLQQTKNIKEEEIRTVITGLIGKKNF